MTTPTTTPPAEASTVPDSGRLGVVLPRLVRPLLLPFAFVLELMALVACAVCIAGHIVFPPALKWGDAISEAVMKLPRLRWYWPNAIGEARADNATLPKPPTQ
jgi:hypothetical protein